jgi:hypothetical protein
VGGETRGAREKEQRDRKWEEMWVGGWRGRGVKGRGEKAEVALGELMLQRALKGYLYPTETDPTERSTMSFFVTKGCAPTFYVFPCHMKIVSHRIIPCGV